jgi:hypothetical protein
MVAKEHLWSPEKQTTEPIVKVVREAQASSVPRHCLAIAVPGQLTQTPNCLVSGGVLASVTPAPNPPKPPFASVSISSMPASSSFVSAHSRPIRVAGRHEQQEVSRSAMLYQKKKRHMCMWPRACDARAPYPLLCISETWPNAHAAYNSYHSLLTGGCQRATCVLTAASEGERGGWSVAKLFGGHFSPSDGAAVPKSLDHH